MHAIIMAGGKGRRLAPYTLVLPKPLMPISDLPILEVVLRQLKFYGVTRITITVGHLANLIMAFFGDGENLGVPIEYQIEDEPRGTIGPLAQVRDLDAPFLVMNGDLLTDLDFAEFAKSHLHSDALVTVATYHKKVPVDLGVMHFDAAGDLIRFQEKPTFTFNVSMGIYMMRPEVLAFVPKTGMFGFDDLMHVAIEQKLPVRSYAFQGRWLDIGRPDDYRLATETFEQERGVFCPWETAAESVASALPAE